MTRGAIGDCTEWRRILGTGPMTLAAALNREPASVQERWFARLYFLKALVFAVLALFWISTGVISLGPGWQEGLSYLREGGIPERFAASGVIAGALADIAIGVGIAFRRTARGALWAAVAISLFYMIAGTFVLPRLWLDPVGPMLKIWPIIVLNLVALAIVEVPVVFITAFPELLLTGQRPEPTFLITKPFHYPAVKAVISQALFFNAKARRPRAGAPPQSARATV